MTTALLNVTYDIIQACEHRFVTVLLLLDYFKAFDSVIHDLLCKKLLSSFNFDPPAVSLIRSDLSDRFQCVSVRDELSSLGSDTKRSCAEIYIRPNNIVPIYQ
jgi:hypothetical protein